MQLILVTFFKFILYQSIFCSNHTFTHVEIKSKSFLFRTPAGKDEESIKKENDAKLYWKHDPSAYFCQILSKKIKNPWVPLNL